MERAGFSGESINIASGTAISIREIVTLLLKELGGARQADFVGQKREGDPDSWCANITTLKALGFENRTSLIDGIKATAQWLKEQE